MEIGKKALMAAGLEDKEANIYLILLQSGMLSLSDIAIKTGIRRTTLYHHLDNLLKRGLISKSLVGKRIHYSPEDPNKVLKDLDRAKDLLQSQIGSLESLYKMVKHRPNTRLYEGTEGIKVVLQEIAQSFKPIEAFFSPAKFFNTISSSDSGEFLKAIRDHENTLYDLVENDSLAEDFIQRVEKNEASFHKVKLLPSGFTVSVDVLVTGDKVAIVSFDHKTALIVDNPEIALFHQSIHQFFWKHLS